MSNNWSSLKKSVSLIINEPQYGMIAAAALGGHRMGGNQRDHHHSNYHTPMPLIKKEYTYDETDTHKLVFIPRGTESLGISFIQGALVKGVFDGPVLAASAGRIRPFEDVLVSVNGQLVDVDNIEKTIKTARKTKQRWHNRDSST